MAIEVICQFQWSDWCSKLFDFVKLQGFILKKILIII